MRSIPQEWLLKKRFVLSMQRSAYTCRPTEGLLYTAMRLDAAPDARRDSEAHRFVATRLGERRLLGRLSRGDCAAFIAIENSTDKPIGYYWAVAPMGNAVWHDKFRIPPGSGLAFNAYVLEAHRRKGVYALLQAAVHNYLICHRQCDTVFTIVESANIASLRANEKFGLKPAFTNYLVKFLRRNLLSVYWSKSGCQVHFVARGIASNSL